MPILISQTDGQTDSHGSIDSATDPEQEYIYFLVSAGYIHLYKVSKPYFVEFSTVKGYKVVRK